MTPTDPSLKVVHISALDRGGAANGCIGLHLSLLEQGVDSAMLVAEQTRHDIAACYPLYESTGRRILAKACNKLWGRHSYKLRGLPAGYEEYSFPYSSHRVEKHPLVESADIINLHWVANFINYPSFFNAVTQPIVWTLHDMNPFSGGVHFAEGFPDAPYRDLNASNTALKQRVLAGKNLHVVSPSRWLCETSQQSLPFGNHAHHVIPYSADTEVFKPGDILKIRQESGIPNDKPVVLFVAAGANNKRKGLSLLLEALGHPEVKDRYTLVVVGRNTETLDLPEGTVTLGEITEREKMAAVYAAADLFVTPAIEDNLPNTVIESLCCGTPVLAFNIGGMPDMITHGQNGWLCERVDSTQLGAAFAEIMAIDFDRNQISHEAHARYQPQVQALAYQALYESLLTNG